MADKEPLLCRVVLGSLRPVTGAAEEATQALGEGAIVKISVVKAKGNTRRLGLYWVCLKKACILLSDAVDGILSRQALHRWLKRDQGLAQPIVSKKTGEVIDYDYESISFETMPEHERSEYINGALERISQRLGCDVTEIKQDAEAETGMRWTEPKRSAA
jgi:hypothetical protein